MDSPFNVQDLSGPAAPSVQHSCVDCRKLSPSASEGFTLFSSRFGWRLLRQEEPATGSIRLDWRCPDCWRAFSPRTR